MTDSRSTGADPKRRAKAEAFVIFGVAIISYLVVEILDLPPVLIQFALDHADWDVDDIIVVAFILVFALLIYGARRYEDVSREIAARTAAERHAQRLARHDALTGLPNRRFFEERLAEVLGAPGDSRSAVLLLDLNGFKQINDTHGHAAGDAALRAFTARAAAALDSGDFLARLGGDEFAIIRTAIGPLDDPADLARRIVVATDAPLVIDRVAVRLGVSIGISVAPDDGARADDLLRRADRALYRAKTAGGRRSAALRPRWMHVSSGAFKSSASFEARWTPRPM